MWRTSSGVEVNSQLPTATTNKLRHCMASVVADRWMVFEPKYINKCPRPDDQLYAAPHTEYIHTIRPMYYCRRTVLSSLIFTYHYIQRKLYWTGWCMSNVTEPVIECKITNIRSRRNVMSHLTSKVDTLTKEQHTGCGMNLTLHLTTMVGLVLQIHLIMKAAVWLH